MTEIIMGIDIHNSTSAFEPEKKMCRSTGKICQFATDSGYCKLSACIRRESEGLK